MFEPIRRQLLLSYLAVLAGILMVFSLAVRIVFIRSLTQTHIQELTLLAKAAATTANFQDGSLELTEAFEANKLRARNQALQWFDASGEFIGQSGQDVVRLSLNESVQVEPGTGEKPHRVLAFTLGVLNEETKQVAGFVRASQSLESLDIALARLDLGLAIGSLVALVLSGMGGFWLMRLSLKPIEENIDQLKQFTADASHELRSPLMAISSNTSVALKYPEGIRVGDRDKFEAIASASHQMAQLTDDLLFLARTEHIPRHQRKALDLAQLLVELVALYQSQATTKGITMNLHAPDQVQVYGDEAQLKRLFTNLIVNALRYTPEQGTVSLFTRVLRRQVVVEVHDTGIGLKPHQLTQVFDRFWQAEEARSPDRGGSGLGLAIAQSIVKRHNGVLTVNSQEGHGSSFSVRLPIA